MGRRRLEEAGKQEKSRKKDALKSTTIASLLKPYPKIPPCVKKHILGHFEAPFSAPQKLRRPYMGILGIF
jgi:hypothetical protein